MKTKILNSLRSFVGRAHFVAPFLLLGGCAFLAGMYLSATSGFSSAEDTTNSLTITKNTVNNDAGEFEFLVSIKKTSVLPSTCFSSGTKVHTKDGLENIEKIKEGDLVLSYDEKEEVNKYSKVINTVSNKVEELYTIKTKDETIQVTGEHLMYSVDNKGFVKVSALLEGDKLLDKNGDEATILYIEKTEKETDVYNLQVDEYSNYFVTDSGYLSYNINLPDEDGKTTIKLSNKLSTTKSDGTRSTIIPVEQVLEDSNETTVENTELNYVLASSKGKDQPLPDGTIGTGYSFSMAGSETKDLSLDFSEDGVYEYILYSTEKDSAELSVDNTIYNLRTTVSGDDIDSEISTNDYDVVAPDKTTNATFYPSYSTLSSTSNLLSSGTPIYPIINNYYLDLSVLEGFTATDKIGVYKVTLQAGESVEIPNIPDLESGYSYFYEVSEVPKDGWKQVSSSSTSGYIEGAQEATFLNAMDHPDLKIRKELVGADTGEFVFKTKVWKQVTDYSLKVRNPADVTGESEVEVDDIDVGNFDIGDDLSFVLRFTAAGTGIYKTQIDSSEVDITPTNTWRLLVNGTETTYSNTLSLNRNDRVEIYFTATINGSMVVGRGPSIDVDILSYLDLSQYGFSPTENEGEYSISIKGGRFVIITDIPAGYEYSIEEVEQDGWTLGSKTNDSGTITADTTATFVNRKDYTPTDPDLDSDFLTIQKQTPTNSEDTWFPFIIEFDNTVNPEIPQKPFYETLNTQSIPREINAYDNIDTTSSFADAKTRYASIANEALESGDPIYEDDPSYGIDILDYFPNRRYRLYQVATGNMNGDSYSSSDFYFLTNTMSASDTLAYIYREGVQYTAQDYTDPNGRLFFDNLTPGIYLLSSDTVNSGSFVYPGQPTFVVVPSYAQEKEKGTEFALKHTPGRPQNVSEVAVPSIYTFMLRPGDKINIKIPTGTSYKITEVLARENYTYTSFFDPNYSVDMSQYDLKGWGLLPNNSKWELVSSENDSGTIIGRGSATLATFNNISKHDLKVEKNTVNNVSGEFQFKVKAWSFTEGIELPPTGGGGETGEDNETTNYTVLAVWKNDAGEDRPDSINVDLFKDGTLYESVSLSDANAWRYSWNELPVGVYKVVERGAPSTYSVSIDSTANSAVINLTKVDNPSEPPAPPDIPPAPLSMRSTSLRSSNIEVPEGYSITFFDMSGIEGLMPAVDENKDGVSDNGEYTFTLKNGDSITFPNIPTGYEYLVEEIEQEGWTLESKTNDSGTITADTTATFVNRKEEKNEYTLSIGKKVEGDMGDTGKEFEFILDLYIEEGGVKNQVVLDFESPLVEKMMIVDGKYGFKLKHNETITLEGIPGNAKYILKEVSSDHNASFVISDTSGTIAQKANASANTDLSTDEMSFNSDQSVMFTNAKEGTSPTGVNANTRPFYLMVLVIGLGIITLSTWRGARYAYRRSRL